MGYYRRMPKIVRQMNKNDPVYKEKRAKNNEAIKRTRQKAKEKAKETETRLENLRSENKSMEDKIDILGKEMKFLKDVYETHIKAKNAVSTPAFTDEIETPDSLEFLDNILD